MEFVQNKALCEACGGNVVVVGGCATCLSCGDGKCG